MPRLPHYVALAALVSALWILGAHAHGGTTVVKKTPNPCFSDRQHEMSHTLMGYLPSCDELTNTGMPVVREWQGLYVVVVPSHEHDYYHVFAIGDTNDPAARPEVVWQGAGLSGLLEQFCKK